VTIRPLAFALLVLTACTREPAEAPAQVSTGTSTETSPETSVAPTPAPAPATPAAPAVNGPKLPFVDEGPNDPSFAAYREQLLAAVRARDAKAVAALADPKIRTSFGGGGGSADLEKMLPGIWDDLEQLLLLGGTFREGSFWAPYVYSAFPDAHDAFETLAVVADDVPLRASADANAPVLATLSRDLVTRASQPSAEKTPWQQVKTADGKTGFVESKFVRSPVGYRAGFLKTSQGWRMNALVAGD